MPMAILLFEQTLQHLLLIHAEEVSLIKEDTHYK